VSIRILTGDCLEVLRSLPGASVNCVVTSPPYYGLRDYGCEGQIGLEETPEAYVAKMVEVFREVRRVLADDGTLWLNIGDSYAGGKTGRADTGADDLSRRAAKYGTGTGAATGPRDFAQRPVPNGLKPKDLIGIPWMLAFALRADGWYLRQDIIWHKPNPMPESVRDRCTKSHEYVFLLAKSSRYFYDADAIREPISETTLDRWGGIPERVGPNGLDTVEHSKPNGTARTLGANPDGRNKRSVWSITTQPFSEAHFATMAPELAETCIKAGCPKGGTVLDPFGGAGTTALCADRLCRNALLIELNPAYVEIAKKRLTNDAGLFAEVAA
jgi:DNA modification methylase